MKSERSFQKPGRGVVSNDIGSVVRRAADEMFAHCDAVVVVGIRTSGTSDNDEVVARATRGPRLLIAGALERMYEIEADRATVIFDDDEETEENP